MGAVRRNDKQMIILNIFFGVNNTKLILAKEVQ